MIKICILNKKLVSGLNNDELTVLYDLFKSGLYSWKVELTVITEFFGVQINSDPISRTFSLNRPPYNGTCSIDPLSGYALQTKFNIICKHWAGNFIKNLF